MEIIKLGKKKPKKKRKQIKKPKKMKRESLNKVDYIHKEGKFGDFQIRQTANGWWASRFNGGAKLVEFLGAIKLGMSTFRACAYAGITKKQCENFMDSHPELWAIIPLLKETINLSAHILIAKQFTRKESPSVEDAKWWAERKIKDDFSLRSEITGADGKDIGEKTDSETKEIAEMALKGIAAKEKILKKLKDLNK